MKNLKVAVVQMTSVDRMAENLTQVLQSIEQAKGADLVVFPENSLYLRLNQEPMVEFAPDGPEATLIAAAAQREKIHVLLTTPTVGVRGKSRNATFHFSPNGTCTMVYTKIHLFDVDVEGAPPVRESDRFLPGAKAEVLEIDGWRFGLSICYDLRFAELYSQYVDRVDAILVPAAFLVPTGQAHWHVLLRARAIENQCYVIAPAQGGEHVAKNGISRKTYGHSLVVDPWGRVELDNDQAAGVNVVELRAEKLSWVRQQIPMQHHRRVLRSER